MPNFVVRCADRNTGEEYDLLVPALSQRSALELAVRDGHLVSSSKPVAHTPEAVSSTPEPELAGTVKRDDNVAALRKDVQSLLAEMRQLRSSPLLERPVSSIAWGIVVGILRWMAVVLALGCAAFLILVVFAILGRALGLL